MWTTSDPDAISLQDANDILQDPTSQKIFPQQFRALVQSVQSRINDIAQKSKEDNPLAWIQPSYEQALKLNCWALGINYIVDFDANRIGKTTTGVINTLLWLFPSQPDWIMHQPHTDHQNRTYHTLPRPPLWLVSIIASALKHLTTDPKLPLDHPTNLEAYKITLNLISNLPPRPTNLPPPSAKIPRVVWIGAPDNDYQEEIIMPEFKKWIPHHLLEDYSAYSHTIRLAHSTTLLFKSYDSKDTKWSGAAVDGIMLTEGVPIDVFNEVRQRYKYPAFASWDYTPYEARNTASKSALAYKVFQGTEQLPLHPYVFSGFGLQSAPEHILPKDKKDDLIRMWEGKPQGDARIKGIFYSSSPVLLKNYTPEIHAIPLTFLQLQQLYAPRPLLLFRGLDPGWGHLCACAYMALAPDNTRYIYRFYARSQRSIDERCEDIINLTGNTLRPHPRDPTRRIEHPSTPDNLPKITWIDYHSFKTDETTKQPFANHYMKAGLIVRPSITYGPEMRATQLNNLLLPQVHLPHPMTKKPPGSKIYFLINEPGVAQALAKVTELFWQTFEKGEKRGMPKDQPQDYDDDELDALCYVTAPTITYQSFFSSIEPREKDGQTSLKGISWSSVDFYSK